MAVGDVDLLMLNILIYIGTMSEVAQSNDTTPSYVGTGAPTVTSMDGQNNTGIVWITSRDGELSAYSAIPVSRLTPSRAHCSCSCGLLI